MRTTQTFNEQDVQRLQGRTVTGSDGFKIGKVQAVYFDNENGAPEWLAVKTGWFGGRLSFLPLERVREQEDELFVPYEKDFVQSAPTADHDGILTPMEEDELYRYYGRDYVPMPAPNAGQAGRGDAMTRSEEELRVATTREEAGRVRLRKWVETEHVSRTVPVSHEEYRIEREPITEANADQAMSGPDISESVHEEPLYEERVVASKETVPKERVRLAKDTVAGEQEVSADLRKERIEAQPADRKRR